MKNLAKFSPRTPICSRRGASAVSVLLWLFALLALGAAGTATYMARNTKKAAEVQKWELVDVYEEFAAAEEKVRLAREVARADQLKIRESLKETEKLERLFDYVMDEYGLSEEEIADLKANGEDREVARH